MPNIALVLKEEIARLARKELRSETEALKKASAHHRSEIAALKKQLEALEKQVAGLLKRVIKAGGQPSDSAVGTQMRFGAKGFASQRRRLDLSAADMGLLIGVSAQTIYNWEAEKSRPRKQQMVAVASLRGVGKRQAQARLKELAK